MYGTAEKYEKWECSCNWQRNGEVWEFEQDVCESQSKLEEGGNGKLTERTSRTAVFSQKYVSYKARTNFDKQHYYLQHIYIQNHL